MTSPVYWQPWLYRLCMRLLYGPHFEGRYGSVASLISEGASVFEACAGDCYLFDKYLRHITLRYTAGDINPRFVKHGKKRGIDIIRHDVLRDDIPDSDYVIMQGSLYQFVPRHEEIVGRLRAACRRRVVISESVVNLAASPHPLVRFIARRSTNAGAGACARRFSETTLDEFFGRFCRNCVDTSYLAPGGRDKIYVLFGERRR
ncbi:MAG: hypothetical protein GF418_08350 [Chitinivibrionales bacterium]|nr:hypothetical protein [Chitinivibrionales bacterium]MBD3395624.1 hypothetical protein [Chitinivibrionales bacterium]